MGTGMGMAGTLIANEVAALAGLYLFRERTDGTPPGDRDEDHPDNTFDLPEGVPLRRKLKQFARRQLKKILGTVPTIGAPLPHSFPSLRDWTDPMAAAMTPLISGYWDEAGKTTRARLGLDPDVWEVHDPHLHKMIAGQSFSFCQETNQTTDKELGEALDDLRREFEAGLVEHGDTIPELRKRVQGVFGRLSDDRAKMIAKSESSRAVHRASLQSAKESEVVQAKKWLAAKNSCDRCVGLEAKSAANPEPLDAEFDHEGSHPEYSSNKEPPAHPHCRCTVVFVLIPAYAKALQEDQPDTYQPGSLGPDPETSPKPKKQPKPKAKPVPAPKPAPVDLAAIPLKEFAAQSMAAAKSVPLEERYTNNKVWISDAHTAFTQIHPTASLEAFKARLDQARASGDIELARADVTAWLAPDQQAKEGPSEIDVGGIAKFHLIVIPRL